MVRVRKDGYGQNDPNAAKSLHQGWPCPKSRMASNRKRCGARKAIPIHLIAFSPYPVRNFLEQMDFLGKAHQGLEIILYDEEFEMQAVIDSAEGEVWLCRPNWSTRHYF